MCSLPESVRQALLLPALLAERNQDHAEGIAATLRFIADSIDKQRNEGLQDFEDRVRAAIEQTLQLREHDDRDADIHELMAGLALLVAGIANGLRAEHDREHPLFGLVDRKVLSEFTWNAFQSIMTREMLEADDPRGWLEGIGAVAS